MRGGAARILHHEDVADQGFLNPRDLLPVGLRDDVRAHAPEHVGQRDLRGRQVLQEGGGEGAVCAGSVLGHFSRRGREGDVHAGRHVGIAGQSGRGVHRACRCGLAHERIVAARVEEDDVGAARVVQGGKDLVHVEQLEGGGPLVLELGVGRHQVVASVELKAVAGVIHDRDIGARYFQHEVRDDAPHRGVVEIVAVHDLETDLA